MSLKKTILLIAIVMTLLFPSGHTLRTQNPWNCFNFTLDESYFAQASQNWVEGKGYRMNHGKPFDPTISSGPVMAWGARAVQGVTHDDLLYSGRIFIHLCFWLLLFLVAVGSFKRSRNWISVPIGVGIFGYAVYKIPFGGYFAYGFLGETPALLAGYFVYRLLDRNRFVTAGIASVIVFTIKPTFVFLVVAVGIAILLRSPKKAVLSGAAMLATVAAYFYGIIRARGETAEEFFRHYLSHSSRIALDTAETNFFAYYRDAGLGTLAFSICIFAFGSLNFLRYRKSPHTSQIAAYLLFVIGVCFYFVVGREPVTKQWSAILLMSLLGLAIHWADAIGNFFASWFSAEQVRAITLAVIATFVFAVGQNAHHAYKRIPESSCAPKEQSAINRELRKLVDSGQATRENLGQITEFQPFSNFLYRMGWDVAPVKSWTALSPSVEWVAGESQLLSPAPAGCEPYWKGRSFSIFRCVRVKKRNS